MSFKPIRKAFNSLPISLQCRILCLKRDKLAIGANSFVHGSVQILGKKNVIIGRSTVISQDTWLNVNNRDVPSPAIVIGDNTFIGRRNFFSSGSSIVVGSYVLTANDCHFLGSSHVVENPMVPYISSGTLTDSSISIGHNSFLGAGSHVLGHVAIGHGCVIGAYSLVLKDIPPFSKAYGSPAVVYQRYSFLMHKWVPIGDFSMDDEMAIISSHEYLAILDSCPKPRMPYVASGSDMGSF